METFITLFWIQFALFNTCLALKWFEFGCEFGCQCSNGSVVCNSDGYRGRLPVLPKGTTSFELKLTAELPPVRNDMFWNRNFESLRHLKFAASNYEEDVFLNFRRLTSLDLMISTYVGQHNMTFICGLTTLQSFVIGPNPGLQPDFSNSCFSTLGNLSNFALSYNNIGALFIQNFIGLQSLPLKGMSFSICSIRTIEGGFFKMFSSLERIDLWNNALTTLSGIEWPPHLKVLNVTYNSLTTFDATLLGLHHLTHLSIQLPDVDDIDFQSLGKLKALNNLIIKNTNMTTISNSTFKALENNWELKHLALTGCSIRDIDPSAFQHLRFLRSLSIDGAFLSAPSVYNTLRDISKNLTHLELQSDSIDHVIPETFQSVTEIRRLQLSFVILRDFPDDIQHLKRLKDLRLSPSKVFDLHTQGSWTLPSVERLHFKKGSKLLTKETMCRFPHVRRVDASRSQLNHVNIVGLFSCNRDLEQINLNGNTLDVFSVGVSPLYYLKSLSFDKNHIFSLSFLSPVTNRQFPALEKLTLSQNILATLYRKFFQCYPLLRHLDLSNNLVQNIDYDTFVDLTGLKFLDLSRNKLVMVAIPIVKPLSSLQSLAIYANPLRCDCINMPLFLFLKERKINLPYTKTLSFDGSQYDCILPDETKLYFTDLVLDPNQCEYYLDDYLILVRFFLIMAIIPIVSLAYRWRWYIRYRYFLIRTRVHRYREQVDVDDHRFRFDGFVSFSKHDCEWVMRYLVPEMENNSSLKLCLYNRNWIAGRDIVDYIVESIEASRKVLFIISNHSATSQWCTEEMALARFKLLRERRDSLVLILLERIDERNMSSLLRHLLRSRVYLEWPGDDVTLQRTFWRTLSQSFTRDY